MIDGGARTSYPHPAPRLWSVRLMLLAVPFVAGVVAAGLRTAAAAYLVSYWGWPEAVAVAVCIEVADLAFLLRFVWTRENGHQDWLAAIGMGVGLASSVAFSILLAFVASNRLGQQVQMARLAVSMAAVGVNAVTYLLAREVAQYVVEHEVAEREWAEEKQRWENARASRADHRLRKIAQMTQMARDAGCPGSVLGVSGSGRPESRSDRLGRMVDLYRTRADWTVSELESTLGVKRSTLYEDRKELVQAGRMEKRPDGYGVAADAI